MCGLLSWRKPRTTELSFTSLFYLVPNNAIAIQKTCDSLHSSPRYNRLYQRLCTARRREHPAVTNAQCHEPLALPLFFHHVSKNCSQVIIGTQLVCLVLPTAF